MFFFHFPHRSAVSSDGGKHQEEEEGEEDDDKTPTDENQVDEEEESKPAPEPEQPATTTADPEDKLTRRERLDKSHRIAEELLSTEEQYVSVLHLIDQVQEQCFVLSKYTCVRVGKGFLNRF